MLTGGLQVKVDPESDNCDTTPPFPTAQPAAPVVLPGLLMKIELNVVNGGVGGPATNAHWFKLLV
jgi:hypothetical protein